jgi:hypothetical protein
MANIEPYRNQQSSNLIGEMLGMKYIKIINLGSVTCEIGENEAGVRIRSGPKGEAISISASMKCREGIRVFLRAMCIE